MCYKVNEKESRLLLHLVKK